ncbi:MAG: hypothetical protein HC805_05045 [Alkalinema sp. RL_2_19]|nr:hypothetical protein [Alkalinema sp. RL_2_19]
MVKDFLLGFEDFLLGFEDFLLGFEDFLLGPQGDSDCMRRYLVFPGTNGLPSRNSPAKRPPLG